jgi:hypothetical protein
MHAQELDLRFAFLPMPAAGKRKARIHKICAFWLSTCGPYYLWSILATLSNAANMQACLNSPRSGASSTLMDRRHQGVQELPCANPFHTQACLLYMRQYLFYLR